MAEPKVKVIAISNVYARCMYFENEGDVEQGHCHSYDHGTLVASGSLFVEMLDDNGSVLGSKTFKAPSFIFIDKLRQHKLTALENKTVAVCIHALREIDGNILSPDFFINEKWFADGFEDSEYVDDFLGLYMQKHHQMYVDTGAISIEERNKRFGNPEVTK